MGSATGWQGAKETAWAGFSLLVECCVGGNNHCQASCGVMGEGVIITMEALEEANTRHTNQEHLHVEGSLKFVFGRFV